MKKAFTANPQKCRKDFINNQFDIIENWLKENIHQYGALYKADVIINKVCGCDFDPNKYCDYLVNKFSKVYEL